MTVEEIRDSEQMGDGTGGADGRGAAADSESIDRLQADVDLLGDLLGEVLREQGDPGLFEAVEHLRRVAIGLRTQFSTDPADELALLQWVNEQSTSRLLQLVRAFSIFFHLSNLAERHHRVRTLAERERAGAPLHESIAAAVAELRGEGVPAGALREGLRRLEVHPVFTAHPSEARRSTLRNHLERAAELLASLDDPRATPRERAATLDALRTRITLIWQTAETRIERPTVLDEVQGALYVLAGTVYDVAPRVHRSLEQALAESYPDDDRVEAPPFLRLGSWVGGDRDGNPAVTAGVTRAAARLARSAILRRYREAVQALGRELSVSERLADASRALRTAVEREAQELGVREVRRWADEPYRRKLALIDERLRRLEADQPGGYDSADDFLAGLRQIEASLGK